MPRGSTIVIKLREDCAEFADAAHVRSVIKKYVNPGLLICLVLYTHTFQQLKMSGFCRYSNFVNFPILVNGERVNTVQALWAMSKNSVSKDQYTEFYRYIANAFDEPRSVMHFSADAPISLQVRNLHVLAVLAVDHTHDV